MRSNVIYSILGVVFSTIIPIIVFPYVSRVLGVTKLGEYNFYNSALTYLALFSSFGITIYGVREVGRVKEDIKGRSNILVELVCLNLIFAVCCLLFVLYCILFTQYGADYKIILIFSIILITNAIGAEWFFVAIEKQKYLLIRNLIVKIISLVLIFLLVVSPDDTIVYAAITVFSLAGVSVLNIIYIIKLSDFSGIHTLHLKRYLNPLAFVFVIEILLRYLGLGDVVILGNFGGDTAVGYYIMGLKIFLLVTSLMKVTATTLLPRAAFYLGSGEFDNFNTLLRDTVNLIFLIGIPCSLGLILWAEPIINLFGGKDFGPSVLLLQGFSCLILVSVIVNMIVFQILYPLDKIRSIIVAHVIGVGLNIILNIVLIANMSYYGTFLAFAISNIVILFILFLLEKKSIPLCIFSRNILKYIYAGILFVLVGLTIKYFCGNTFYLMQMFVCGGIYLWILYYCQETFMRDFLKQIKLRIK